MNCFCQLAIIKFFAQIAVSAAVIGEAMSVNKSHLFFLSLAWTAFSTLAAGAAPRELNKPDFSKSDSYKFVPIKMPKVGGPVAPLPRSQALLRSGSEASTPSPVNLSGPILTPHPTKSATFDELYAAGKYQEASSLLRSSLKQDPANAKTWSDLARCAEALKDYHGSLGAYEISNSLSDDVQTKAAILRIKGLLGRKKESDSEERKAAADLQLKLDRIALLNQEAKYGEALAIVNSIVKSDSHNHKLWMQMGVAKQGLADYHGALAAYEMASRLSANNSSATKAASDIRVWLEAGSNPPAPKLPNLRTDFGPYTADVSRRIKRAWYPPLASANKPVTMKFKIAHNGSISDLTSVQKSGDELADRAMEKAIENASPFRPLPNESPDFVEVTVHSGLEVPSEPQDLQVYLPIMPKSRNGTFRPF